jgi:hypothetical protein
MRTNFLNLVPNFILILIVIRARGHAAEILLLLFVTDLVATKRCVPLAAARLITAAMPAVKRSGGCVIVNVSGWRARPKRDDSNATSNIRPNVAQRVFVHPSDACRR